MPDFVTLTQSAAGRYQVQVLESMRCRSVRVAALDRLGYGEAFRTQTDTQYQGTDADHARLSPDARSAVDAIVAQDIIEQPALWRESPHEMVADTGEHPNLILDQGLNNIASAVTTWQGLLEYCALGFGTGTPAVTDTVLGTESVRTSNYLSGSSTTADDLGTRTRTYSKTFDFPVETVPKNYTELGLAHAASGPTSLDTRALISGGTVTVGVGQQARVVYSIAVTLPANSVATPNATGWPVPPATTVRGIACFISLSGVSRLDQPGLVLCTGSTIPTFGGGFSYGTTNECSSSGFYSYVPGSFKSSRWATWNLSSGNGTTWRALLASTYPVDPPWVFIFDQGQTKDNQHSLTITWSVTYGRA